LRSNAKSLRLIGPHYLYVSQGGLYLVGEDLAVNKVKVFSLARMGKVAMLDEVYEGTVTKPEDFFQHSLGMFRSEHPETLHLRFDRSIARLISEREWHPSQKLERHSDGKLDLRLTVGITPDVLSWIMSYGVKVEVLAPESLRDRVTEECQAVTELYRIAKKKAS
jgi:proteasome accessory factor B